MKPVIHIVCPAGNATGGTELLHQFGAKLITFGADARMVYWPTDSDKKVPPALAEYNIPHCRMPADAQDVIIVFPEIFSQVARSFNLAKVVLWWLSVDNYFFSRNRRRGTFNRWLLQRLDSQSYWFFESYIKSFDLHLYQSTYARDLLNNNGIKNYLRLQDYLHSSFLNQKYDINGKNKVVVYNPKKGAKFTQQLIIKFPLIKFIALENMSRDEVIRALRNSMIYLDFGHHPGMDRIPREAAALGCCVITNRMGSAAYHDDLPIPAKYKIDTSCDFTSQTGILIHAIFGNFFKCHAEFSGYRRFISSQENRFDEDLISVCNALLV